MMKPLQVMPLDESFNLVSGPLDYESLQWNRKYYETGDFSMSVLSTDYDPSWAYIYTPFRPEMGIIQKVEFSDTSHTPDGKDTVTVSGFFMEYVLDKLVFLVEQTEQEKVIVPKPTRPPYSAPKPNLKQDSEGNLYFEYDFPEAAGGPRYNRVDTGECIWPHQIEGEETWTDVPLSAGEGMSEETFPILDFEGNQVGTQHTGWYNTSYNYYSSSDGKLHCVDGKGGESTYDLVGNGTNAVVYKDTDGSYKWVWGVVEEGEETAGDRYRRETEKWERLAVDEETGERYYYRTVKGPWQLRTDINDVTTPQDNVQWVIKMAQKVFGNNFFYDEPDFTGETKVLSPSLTRIGDFFRQELRTVEAGLRIFYSFKANQMIFQIWRGLDRTQDENAPGADDYSVSLLAESDYPLPEGYTQLEYIESTGTQWINTGFIPDQDTRVTFTYMAGSEGYICGAETNWVVNSFTVYTRLCAYNTGSYQFKNTFNQEISVDFNKGSYSDSVGNNGSIPYAQFSSGLSMFIFGDNRSGSFNEPISARVYAPFNVYDNGALVRSFYPARREIDLAIGMYDTVDGVFYGNSGTGVFTAGPDIPRPADPEPEPEPTPGGNAWAVFSDKWGSLYDYSASVDDSNYRNMCYVLHDFDEPEWDNDGHPVVETVTGESMLDIIGYRVWYKRNRGQYTVRLEDDYEDRETWLDKRDEKPEQDQDWPRDMQKEMPDVSGVTKESYDQFKTSLQNEGRAYLEENYPIVKNLDTGTLDMSEYLTGFDLGDKVDMEVSTLGLKETARIIEVDEVHESGNSEIHLVMGEEMVTSTRKAGLN